jgi:hypothetical protein
VTPVYSLIPPATLETLEAWARSARPVGSFVEAVLCNDLREAFSRADEDNILAMFHTVAWCYNYLPGLCWGSREAFKRWPEELAELRRFEATKKAAS